MLTAYLIINADGVILAYGSLKRMPECMCQPECSSENQLLRENRSEGCFMSVDKDEKDEYDVPSSRPKSAPGASVAVAIRHSSRNVNRGGLTGTALEKSHWE